MIKFLKMSAVENDFIIFDARESQINLSAQQIQKLCHRKNIGCDQLVIIKNSANADGFIEIYNQDGSQSKVCGNATRCVAALLMDESNSSKTTIDSAAGLLNCRRQDDKNISVEMPSPIFMDDFSFDDSLKFFCVDMGNPHAINFAKAIPQDDEFFKIAPKVEVDHVFPQKTNVEFAKIISDNLIEVRVWERGVGETSACGSGACAVAVAAIKNNLVKAGKVTTRFKGGDLQIEWHGDPSSVIMTGGYQKIFTGKLDQNFL